MHNAHMHARIFVDASSGALRGDTAAHLKLSPTTGWCAATVVRGTAGWCAVMCKMDIVFASCAINMVSQEQELGSAW